MCTLDSINFRILKVFDNNGPVSIDKNIFAAGNIKLKLVK